MASPKKNLKPKDKSLNKQSGKLQKALILINVLDHITRKNDDALKKCTLEKQFPILQQLHQRQVQAKKSSNMQQQEQSPISQSQQTLSQIFLYFDGNLNKPHSNIGLLIVIKGNEQAVSTSTAFLVNEHTLVTCLHSFQNKLQEFTATEIIFIPGCVDRFQEFRYRCKVQRQDVHTTYSDPKFTYLQVGRQLAVLYLQKPISLGITVPKCMSIDKLCETQISIIGYPSASVQYDFRTDTLRQKKIIRQIFQGRYVNLNEKAHQIEYDIAGRPGMSGAPIMGYFLEKGRKKPCIIGLHTHGARKKNFHHLGLLFTKQVFEILDKFIQQNPYMRDNDSNSESNSDAFQELQDEQLDAKMGDIDLKSANQEKSCERIDSQSQQMIF